MSRNWKLFFLKIEQEKVGLHELRIHGWPGTDLEHVCYSVVTQLLRAGRGAFQEEKKKAIGETCKKVRIVNGVSRNMNINGPIIRRERSVTL